MQQFTLLILAVLVFNSSNAQSLKDRLRVHPANSQFCNLGKPSWLKTPEPIALAATNKLLTDTLEKWLVHFDIAQDHIVSHSGRILCFGFYEDGANPNASAISTYGIFFGTQLVDWLSTKKDLNYNHMLIFILAHEFSHFIQNANQLNFDYTLPMLSTKIKELHADCIAGYILRAHEEVMFASQDQLKVFVAELGDPHSIGDHGLADQRVEAFDHGMTYASRDLIHGVQPKYSTTAKIINSCSQFYTHTK